MPRYSFGNIRLPKEKITLFNAIAHDSTYSKRALASQMVRGHLLRFKSSYTRMVFEVAKLHGLEPEKAFEMLCEGKIVGSDELSSIPIGICLDGEREGKGENLSIGNIDLTHEYIAWCKVILSLSRLSQQEMIGTFVECHLNRWEGNYHRQIEYRARMHNLPFEETLDKLSNKEDLGMIVNPAPIDFPKQKTNFGIETDVYNFYSKSTANVHRKNA